MDLVLLKLVAAHLVARSWFLCSRKHRGTAGQERSSVAAARAIGSTRLYALLATALLLLPSSGWADSGLAFGALLISALLRLLVDVLTAPVALRSWLSFLLTEVGLVLAVLLPASIVLREVGPLDWMGVVLDSPRTYGLITVYVASAGLGSVLVSLVTGLLRKPDETGLAGLEGAGRYIGVLERLLVTSLIIFWPTLDAAAIGFIFSAKSIARFPEFKKPEFAEYYLLGSLTSFTIAIALGLLARTYL